MYATHATRRRALGRIVAALAAAGGWRGAAAGAERGIAVAGTQPPPDAGAAATASGASNAVHRRPLRDGGSLPVIGMGTWVTFYVGADAAARAVRTEVMREFVDAGGGLVDSSPMYGSAEAVVGHALAALGHPPAVFAATKVWTASLEEGGEQLADSFRLWGVERFGLLQVHNLVGWERHLRWLRDEKAAGRIAHLGVTTSHGRRHDELERILAREPVDFVQLTYNVADRDVEARLLPLAQDRGIAVIANRPFRRGALLRRLESLPVPGWVAETHDATTWPQVLLKWIVAHPALTCAIPATSQPAHMVENMAAGRGRLPDADARGRLVAWLADH
jgi:diketogulonate reductase-like aldo/keto reductase